MKTDNLVVEPIPILKDNYVWTIIDIANHTALIVDPGVAKPVNDYLKNHHLTLQGILITHHHWDHTDGVSELKQQYHIPVFGPANSIITDISAPLHEQNIIRIDDFSITLQALEIPGHTLDHIAYYAPQMLFCGDTLFAAGCGKLFEGSAAQMYASLQKITALPTDTKIYCAHEYTLNNLHFATLIEPGNNRIIQKIEEVTRIRNNHLPSLPSTLAEEMETNPFLRCNIPEVIASVEHYAGRPLPTPLDVFTWMRKWKDELVLPYYVKNT